MVGVSLGAYDTLAYSTVTVAGADGVRLAGHHSTVMFSVVTNNSGGANYALDIIGSSANVVTQSVFANSGGQGVMIQGGNSTGNTISFSTVTAGATQPALGTDSLSSANTLSQDYFSAPNGTGLNVVSPNVTVSQSTAVVNNASFLALSLGGGNDTVTQSVILNPAGQAAVVSGSSDLIVLSSVTSGVAGVPAILFSGGGNSLSQSAVSGGGGVTGALEVSANGTSISQSFVTAAQGAAVKVNVVSGATAIAGSTVAAYGSGSLAVQLMQSGAAAIENCYLQASTGVYVFGSTATAIGGSTIAVTAAGGVGVEAVGSVGLSLSSSTLLGPGAYNGGSAGVMLSLNSGLLALSTNTIGSGAQWGIFAGTQTPGTQVWITSNTIVPTVANGAFTYGVFLDGLISGATVQQNTISFRASGSAGAGAAYGFAAQSTIGADFDHNRIDEPGTVTGQAYLAYLSNAVNTTFKYDDLYAKGGAGAGALLLRAGEGSSNLAIRDGIFAADMAAPGAGVSTGTLIVADAGSQTGLTSDYNDFFSSQAASAFQWGGPAAGLAGWQGLSGKDANSISADPLWVNTAAGAEDFHPKSSGGRYNQVTGGVSSDAILSPTIDAGDPAEPFGNEPSSNGGRVNQGSYGNTGQASRTPVPFPGCAYTARVGAAQAFPTIMSAVGSFPATITGQACVVIEDGATYVEQVTVSGFSYGTSVSSITIFADPGTGLTPVVSPPASAFAAFSILNASVNVKGILVQPSAAMAATSYGFFVSSPNVTLSSVSVLDTLGRINNNGIQLANWDNVSSATVYTTAPGAGALAVPALAANDSVSGSSLTASGAGAAALYIGGSNVTVANCAMTSNAGTGLFIAPGASQNSILQSTVTTGPSATVDVQGSSNTFVQDRITGGGATLQFEATSTSNTVVQSTITGTANSSAVTIYGTSTTITLSVITNAGTSSAILMNGFPAPMYNVISFSSVTNSAFTPTVQLANGSSSNTFTHDFMANGAGTVVNMQSASASNLFTQSTITAVTGNAVYITNSASNTISQCAISDQNGSAVRFDAGSSGNAVVNSTVTETSNYAAFLSAASSNAFTADIINSGNYGVYLDIGANGNSISLTTVTTSGSSQAALYIAGASSNVVTFSYLYAPNSNAANLGPAANSNTIAQSQLYSNSGFDAVFLNGASSNTLTQDFIAAGAGAAVNETSAANGNAVDHSTLTSVGGIAFIVANSSANALTNSYVQNKSTNVLVNGSTATFLSGDSLFLLTGAAATAQGVSVVNGSVGLTMRQTTLSVAPGVNSAEGLYVAPSNGGVFDISTNTFSAGPAIGIDFSTLTAGARVWIASNTVYYNTAGAPDTNGFAAAVYLGGAAQGAAFRNNSVFGRAVGGVATTRYAVLVDAVWNAVVDHNRITFPVPTTGGSDVSVVELANNTGIQFKFNDVSASGAGLNESKFAMVRVANAGSAVIKDNVFSSSVTAVSAPVMIAVDNASAPTLQSDYNDFFSSNSALNSSCNGVAGAMSLSWTCSGSNLDQHSISGNPLWVSAVAGSEDFHPLSAGGRFLNGVQQPPDAATSPTIDAADPSEDYTSEPAPNGFRANQGSYGITAEASETPPQPCAITRTVCKSGCPNATIGGAIGSIPSLQPGYRCVIIQDTAVYNEQITIPSGYMPAGSSMTVTAGPGATPTLSWNGNGYAGVFVTGQSSVSVVGLKIVNNGTNNAYGIGYSGSVTNINITSVTVVDAVANGITVAGIAVSSQSTISYSTVTVTTANGIKADGGYVTVAFSTINVTGNAATPGHAGLYAAGETTTTVSGVTVLVTGSGDAATFNGSQWTRVSQSSFTTASANEAVDVGNTSFASLTQSYFSDAGGLGSAITGSGVVTQSTMTGTGANYTVRSFGMVLSNDLVLSPGGGVILIISGGISSCTVSAGNVGQAAVEVDGSGTSVSNSFITSSNGTALDIYINSNNNSIVASTMIASAAGSYGLSIGIAGATTRNTVTQSYISNSNGVAAFLTNVTSNTISFSTIAATAVNQTALSLTGATTSTFLGDFVYSPSGLGAKLDAASAYNAIYFSTFVGGGGSNYGLSFLGASRNSVTGSVIQGGALLDLGASNNTISQSTMTNGAAGYALSLQTASTNTVSQSYVANLAGNAAGLGAGTGVGCSQNVIAQSVLITSGTGANTVTFNGASTNVFTGDMVISGLATNAIVFQFSSSNTITLSTVTGAVNFSSLASSNAVTQSYIGGANFGVVVQGGSGYEQIAQDSIYPTLLEAVFLNGSQGNSVSQSFLVSPSTALTVLNSGFTAVANSTMIATGATMPAFWSTGSYVTAVEGSYVQGSTAALVSFSTTTAFGGDVFYGASGSGILFTQGGAGVYVSSSVVYAGAAGVGQQINGIGVVGNTQGPVIISSNVVASGPQIGINVQSGAPIYITSNTIVPTINASLPTAGIVLAGVSSATVQNNGIYFRTSGAAPAWPSAAFGLYLSGAASAKVDHNRISNPGMVTGGQFLGVYVQNSPYLSFRFNDLYGGGVSLSTPTLLHLDASSGAVVTSNVFFNNMTPLVQYTMAMFVDAGSEVGLRADYNDFFIGPAAGAFIGGWGAFPGPHPSNLGNWRTTSGGDAHSISGDPLWASTGAFNEDFHPKSSAGRYSPAAGGFVIADSTTSPTVDAGDPAEPYNQEPNPNGVRANQGSYGDTPQASKTPPLPGCPVQITVDPTGGADALSITQALTLVANPMTLDTCIIDVNNTASLFEEASVFGINNQGHRLNIMGHPNLVPPPVIDPNGNTAAFRVQNDSVTVFNLNIVPSGAATYGVYATSNAVHVSSVNVIDPGNRLTGAGIVVSSGAVVSWSSVTVQNAAGIVLVGAGANVSLSSAANTFASSAALFLNGASSATIAQFFAQNGNGPAVGLTAGANSNALSQVVASGGTSGAVLVFSSATSNSVSNSFVLNSGGGGGVQFSASNFDSLVNSTVSISGAILPAVRVSGSSGTVLAQDYVAGGSDGLLLDVRANASSVSGSTVVANLAGGQALHLIGASSNVITGSVMYNLAGPGAALQSASNGNVIQTSTVTGGNGSVILAVSTSARNQFVSDYFPYPYTSAQNVVGVQAGSDFTLISQSTITSPGAPGVTPLTIGALGATVSQSVILATGSPTAIALNNNVDGGLIANTWVLGSGGLSATGSANFTVAASTILALGSNAATFTQTSGMTLAGSYLQGPAALKIAGSTGTVVSADVLVALVGDALLVTAGGQGLTASSSVFFGGNIARDVFVDVGEGGPIVFSTNTFAPTALADLSIATPTAGAALYITSNTFVAPLSGSGNSYGLYMNGLTSGATIENNTFVYRAPAAIGVRSAALLYGQTVAGLVIDHNRFSNPGMVLGAASFHDVYLSNALNVTFKFNDVYSTAAAVNTALFRVGEASAWLSIRDNVFSSSFTAGAGVSTATLISQDAGSLTGLSADFNDYFSSNPVLSFFDAGTSFQGLSGWRSATGQENSSISLDPRYVDPRAGVEDFHPLSQAGRVEGGVGQANDAWSAGTIDRADPAEPFGGEPAPNGGRANLGSYGGTGDASRSPAALTGLSIAAINVSSIAVSFNSAANVNSYVVAASSVASLSPIFASSSSAVQTTLAPQGLNPDTTYYMAAAAIWGDLMVVSTTVIPVATLAAPPGVMAPTFTSVVGQTSASLQWLANGDPIGQTTYTVVMTTEAAYPNADAGNRTLVTAPASNPPSATIFALAPNTTYFAFAAAANWAGLLSPFTFLGSTATVPAQPAIVTPSFVAVASNAVVVSWSPNGNPVGVSTYTVQVSTDPTFANVFASSATVSTAPAAGTPTATLTGLLPDTTYFLRVQTNGSDGQNSAFVNMGSTSTLAVTPTFAAFAVPSNSQIQPNWIAVGNPPGVLYEVLISSTPGFTGAVTSSFTYNLFASTAGLAVNTSYYFQLAAFNNTGVATPFTAVSTAATLANAPAPTGGPVFSGVGSSSFSVTWSSNGNPINVTTYTVVASTASDFNAYATSVTVTTAPATFTPSCTFSGLSAFTTYYVEVFASNRSGVATSASVLGSTQTLPPTLFPPVLQTLAVYTTSATAVWTLVPTATGYTLVASTMPTNPPTAVWASSGPVGVTATTATVTGLQPDTTYFFFVQSNGVAAMSAFSAYAATPTAPAYLSTGAFASVFFTSVSVNWYGNGNPLAFTTYTITASTDPAFGVGASSVTLSTVPAAGPSATLTGLFANTTYYVEIRALGINGSSTPFATIGATTTPVAPPLVLSPSLVFSSPTAIVAAWGANANPLAITSYVVVASTASDFNAFASSVVFSTSPAAGPSAAFTGLSANTTYYVGARGLGVNGSSSAFVVLGATSTAAVPPVAAAFTGVTVGQIQANWTSADPAGTRYQLQASTSPVFGGTVTSSFTYNLFASTAGLLPNTTYSFQVLALNNDGVATAFVPLGSTSTLANAPLTAVATFTAVYTSSVSLQWLANGNPLGFTTYTVVASTASDFNAFASSVVFTTAPAAGPSATMTGLAFGTTYFFQVRAVNNDGVPTAYANLGSTYTVLSSLFPLIVNFQGGDAQWRASNNGLYNVRFQDGSGTHLNKFQVKASTTPGGLGTDLIAFTDAVVGISPADSYVAPWPLPAAVFNALMNGVTNYITVRVFNNIPNSTTLQDAFFVLKDTTPPAIVNTQAGDNVVRSSSGTTYTVAAGDPYSGLAAFQYSASTTTAGDASLIGWTDVVPSTTLAGTTSYVTPWPVNFAALVSGVTNYVSVRTWNLAGTTTTLNNAFYVLKDTAGPSVAISTPNAATGYVGPFGGTAAGAASSVFPIQGDEIAVFQSGINLYWNPGASAFNSGSPVWMAAVGQSTWSFNLNAAGIAFVDGTGYKIIARSSTTFNQYSTVYATSSFVFSASTPTVGVQAPVPNSTVPSLPVISGTAANVDASGVAAVEVRLRRFSDGLYWNWFTQAWSGLAVSTFATGTTAWSVSPTPQLQANLLSGASYFIAVRASDNSLPVNQGNFFTQGATFTFSNPTPPNPVSDLSARAGALPGQIALSWHATGENGNTGIVLSGQYAVFYATYGAATPSTSAAQVLFSTGNVAPGQPSSYTVVGLSAGVTYFLEIALRNSDGNWSAFSNQASTVATPAPLNAILGHVVDASTNGITGVEVDAWNASGALVSTAFTLADGSGTYSVGGLSPGTYKLQARWTVNGVTSSVWQDGIPMGTVGVDFSLNISYALATLTGSLASLTTSAARTATTPQALLRPRSGGSSSYIEVAQGGKTITSVGVPPSGRWVVPSLLPGQYAVRAWTGVSYTDYQNVALAEGETKQVIFALDALADDAVFAFPNPAKNSTTFRFVTPYNSFEALIDVFDVSGRLVREIPGSMIKPWPPTPGLYHADWDLTNSRGQAVASGVYLFSVKIKGSDGTVVKVVKKLAVVR